MLRIALGKKSGWFVLSTLVMVIAGALPLRADDQPSKPFSLLGLEFRKDGNSSSGISLTNFFQGNHCDSGACSSGCGDSCCDCQPWQGFYFGGDATYVWGEAQTDFNPLPSAAAFVNLLPQTIDVNPGGLLLGVHAGYNVQRDALVVGAEVDFKWRVAHVQDTHVTSPIIQNNGTPFPTGFLTSSEEIKWLSTVRGRTGLSFDCVFDRPVLVYVTGGLAFAEVEYMANIDPRPVGNIQFPADINRTKFGYCIGAGVEVKLSCHWSWKTEYLFYDLGHQTATANGVPPNPPFQVQYDWDTRGSTVTTALSYKF